MKLYLILFLFFISNNLYSQFGSCIEYGIINDPDGYTNVREKPSSKSKIIHILKKDIVFEIAEDSIINDWVKIRLVNNKYGIGDINQTDNNVIGFVHNSRIIILNNLDNYDGSEVEFSITNEPFESSTRVISRYQGDKWLTHIDGRPIYGTDGNMPNQQVKDISLIVNGKQIPIHDIFKTDLFECRNHFNLKKVEDTFFAYQSNSDGAGFYEILWVFNSEKLLQRIISIYPC